jgi:hypothetical protein
MRETEEQRGWEDNLTIPDYVMWDFERYGCERKEQEVTVTQKGSNQRKPTAKRASGPAYWLIKKSENGRIEMLTFYGGDVLPVFSFGEEAEMFHRFSGVGDDWQVSESEAEELVSVLYGPIAGVKEVALDPLPEMVAERTVGLISLRGHALWSSLRPEGEPPVVSASRVVDRRSGRTSRTGGARQTG